jgi:hypothetical protein
MRPRKTRSPHHSNSGLSSAEFKAISHLTNER